MGPSSGTHSEGERRRPPGLVAPVDQLVGNADADYARDVIARRRHPYHEFLVPKASHGTRIIHSPEPELMAIQRGLLDGLINDIAAHPCAMAYRRQASVVECASRHLGAQTVVRLDIVDFFRSLKERHVFEALLNSEWPDRWAHARARGPLRLSAYQLAVLMTVSPPRDGAWVNRGTGSRLVDGGLRPRKFTYVDQTEGFLPQGAPTSGAISNLIMRDVDESLYRWSWRHGLRYTRYSDDLYFSSPKAVSHDTIRTLVAYTRKALRPLGLKLNDDKSRVARASSRRSVLGILVDGSTLRLPRETHRAIDLHLRGVDRRGLEGHARARGFADAEALRHHVEGRIAWVRQVEPARGEGYLAHWLRSVERSQVGTSGPTELLQWAEEGSGATPENLARESIDRLLADGRAYRRSTDYAEFISFIGRFRYYSPFNAAMVKLQKPGSRHVATDKVWTNKYGRVVAPGAQPLVIMQPGGPYMVVYDVGDTEALPGSRPLPTHITDPLAAVSLLSSREIQRRWEVTVDNAIREGFRVTRVDNAPLHAGQVSWTRRKGTIHRPGARPMDPAEEYPLIHDIEVSRNLSQLDQYVTLVHELAHIYCGHLGTPDRRRWPSRPGAKVRNEVEAETVAYIVMTRLDPTFRMGDYLLNYLGENPELPEGVGLRQMIQVATQIMKMGEGRLAGPETSRRKATLVGTQAEASKT